MKFIASLVVFSLIHFAIIAGDQDLLIKYWYTGEVFLNTGEKLKGNIFYEIDKELLLVYDKGQIKTYSPNQIDKFLIIDSESGTDRMFYSIPITASGAARRSYFFEIMIEGEIVYLRKQRTRSDGYGLFVFDESKLPGYSGCFNYFLLYDDALVRIKKFKRDVLCLMSTHKEKMDIFIQKNGLQLNSIKDQVRILKYYNTLCEDDILANERKY